MIFFILYKLHKKFKSKFVAAAGRNFLGRICVQHQGGSNKNLYLKVDRYRYINKFGLIYRILRHFFFTGYVGLIIYSNGLCNFILLSENVKKGNKVFSGGNKAKALVGSTQKILNIKLFDAINSIEKFPFSGAKLARAAGTFSNICSKEIKKSILKMSSGWQISISNHSLASLGMVSHPSHIYTSVEKAGISRIKGIRPTVRGVIKNPCDHPHGGGEGRGSPPAAHVSPWGWLCRGTPSKNRKKDRLKRKLYKKR